MDIVFWEAFAKIAYTSMKLGDTCMKRVGLSSRPTPLPCDTRTLGPTTNVLVAAANAHFVSQEVGVI